MNVMDFPARARGDLSNNWVSPLRKIFIYSSHPSHNKKRIEKIISCKRDGFFFLPSQPSHPSRAGE